MILSAALEKKPPFSRVVETPSTIYHHLDLDSTLFERRVLDCLSYFIEGNAPIKNLSKKMFLDSLFGYIKEQPNALNCIRVTILC
jgi:hypothetical protein